MKKIIFWLIISFFSIIIFSLFYLSYIGFETDKFNSHLEKKIATSAPNTKINLNKIKIKINIKNLNFFLTTLKPDVTYQNNDVKIKKIDAYINLKSLFSGNPKIEKINKAFFIL